MARPPLYGKREAECLEVRETMRDDHIKYGLLLEHLGPCKRLVEHLPAMIGNGGLESHDPIRPSTGSEK